MKIKLTQLLIGSAIVLSVISCSDNPEIKISNFNGITSKTASGNYAGEIDTTDWGGLPYDEWNQDELDLFGYLTPSEPCGIMGDISINSAYPNPVTNHLNLKVNCVTIFQYKFSYRLVDRYHNILKSEDSLNVTYGETIFQLDLSDITTTDTLRLYYAFFENIPGCCKIKHGDIVKN